MAKGKLIVIYGVNNLGKSTQAKLLVEKLNFAGRKAKYVKYPVYDLEPTGPTINEYIRGGNPKNLTAKDAQVLYAKNREQYEPILKNDLEEGFDVVAEDYSGTGVAWGVGAGVDKAFLIDLNRNFIKEDLAILLAGKRFMSGKEEKHLHEENHDFADKVEKIHRELAAELGWKVVNANANIEEVAASIWQVVQEVL